MLKGHWLQMGSCEMLYSLTVHHLCQVKFKETWFRLMLGKVEAATLKYIMWKLKGFYKGRKTQKNILINSNHEKEMKNWCRRSLVPQ